MSKKNSKNVEAKPIFTIKIEGYDKINTVGDLLDREIKFRQDMAEKLLDKAFTVSRTVRWPKTWWQHVKEDLFPDWAKSKWPVEYDECTYLEVLNAPADRSVGLSKHVLATDKEGNVTGIKTAE